MTLELAIALIALLVALFTLVALVAVYARVRMLEAGRARPGEVSGYAPLVGGAAPEAVRAPAGLRGSLVAVLDADCALCHDVLAALGTDTDDAVRAVAVTDRPSAFTAPAAVDVVADVETRVALFEGYAPTLLAVDATGRVRRREFVYADTDLPLLLSTLRAELGARTQRTSA